MNLLRKYYLFFLSANVFLPKINFGFGSFYVFDFANILIFLVLISRGRLFIKSIIIQTYVLFVASGFLAFVVGMFTFGFIDVISLVRLMKFLFFAFYMIVPFYIYRDITSSEIKRLINYQIVFFLIAGAYVVFNMISHPKKMSDYIWEYDNKYRLIGLTGYDMDLHGHIELAGSTSVSMGVFIAFIFFLCISNYIYGEDRWGLIKALILLPLELLTYSRAGIVALIIGGMVYLLLNVRYQVVLKWFAFVSLFITLGFTFNFFDRLSEFGTFGKIFKVPSGNDSSVNIRVNMLERGVDYVFRHPYVLIAGSGYGEDYTLEAISYPHLEGLMPTTLFTSGLLAVLVLTVHFFFLFRQSKMSIERSAIPSYAYGLVLFIPGWFVSAIIAGNTFQTDFLFPLIYFVFFCTYFKTKNHLYDDSLQPAILSAS